MRIKVERRWPKDKYIIGRLYIDGEFICNTLEPPWKNNARYTAIPKGVYEVIMNYSPKFRRVLPLLLDVPQRSAIRIHRLNRPSETQGCIGPGLNTQVGMITSSTKYEELICKKISEAKARKEKVYIEVV